MRIFAISFIFLAFSTFFACKNDKSASGAKSETVATASNILPSVANAPAIYTDVTNLYNESMKDLESVVALQKHLKNYLSNRNSAAPPSDTLNSVQNGLRALNRAEHSLGEWKTGFNNRFDTLKTPELKESYLAPKKAEIESIRNFMKFAIEEGNKASAIVPK